MKELEKWLGEKQLLKVAKVLERRGFNTFLAPDKESAKNKILDIIPEKATVGIGGSITIRQLNIIEELEKRGHTIYHHWKEGLSLEEDLEIRKKELTSDVFLSSVNAITFSGELVNIDTVGNRVAAQIFGPKQVIIVAGKNKLVVNLETALWHIRNVVTPLNAKRLNIDVPCGELGYCVNECNSSKKMCRIITILEAPPSKTPFWVILVNEELGF